jgi:hypothetical protein
MTDGGEEVNETASRANSRGSESPEEEEVSGSDAGEPEEESSDSEDERENLESDHRKMLPLSQTVTVFKKKVNICFDNGSTISVISRSVDVPYIFKKVEEVGIAPVEEGLCIEALLRMFPTSSKRWRKSG